MKRVLAVHPRLVPVGGGAGVAAWGLQALRPDHALTLLAWEPPDLELVNGFFGTSLVSSDFTLRVVSPVLRASVEALPTPAALLRQAVLQIACRRLCRESRYDVVLSFCNEFDFGRRGIQYVHYPWLHLPRPRVELRWYHRAAAVRVYRALAQRLGRTSKRRLRENLTLVNSEYVGDKVREVLGVEPRVLYPPVIGDAPEVPWEERSDAFVCLGRFSPDKETHRAIEIVRRLRARGRDVVLHLLGTEDGGHAPYAASLRAQAEEAGDRGWLSYEVGLRREQIAERMARCRYGLHAMRGEHFGMAVAELQRAGCLVFVPDRGGAVEIVGREPCLIYASVEEAVEKIDRVLADVRLQASLREGAAARREWFSVERFQRELRALVSAFP